VCGAHPSTLPPGTFDAAALSDCTGFTPFYPHWAWDCTATIEHYCGSSMTLGSAGSGATTLQGADSGVVGFSGDANGSFVTLMGPGNIIVTGSLTLVHPYDSYHSRVSCQPQVRRSNTADQYTPLGVPTIVSGSDVLEITHVTVTGGAYFATPGDYDYQIACRIVDEYTEDGIDNWTFAVGNAIATTTEL
jgi:hypothetical protein